MDQEKLQAILEEGDLNSLIGSSENDWLECKSKPYRLEFEKQKWELAKDVSGFANSNGGRILIGVKTEKDPIHRGDVVKEIRAFGDGLVNGEQYRKLIEDRIYPKLEGLRIEWFKALEEEEKGIVVIDIPRQQSGLKPFLVKNPLTENDQKVGYVFGYCERKNDSVDHLSLERIHSNLKDGLNYNSKLESKLNNISESIIELHKNFSENRDEIDTAFDKENIIRERVWTALEKAKLTSKPVIYFAAFPTDKIQIPELFNPRDSNKFCKLIEDPPSIRSSGFDLCVGKPSDIVAGKLRRTFFDEDRILELWKDGALIFCGNWDEGYLSWGMDRESESNLLMNPIALTESTYLFTLLARKIYELCERTPENYNFIIGLKNISKSGEKCRLPKVQNIEGRLHVSKGFSKPARDNEFENLICGNYEDMENGVTAFNLVGSIYDFFDTKIGDNLLADEVDGQWVVNKETLLRYLD